MAAKTAPRRRKRLPEADETRGPEPSLTVFQPARSLLLATALMGIILAGYGVARAVTDHGTVTDHETLTEAAQVKAAIAKRAPESVPEQSLAAVPASPPLTYEEPLPAETHEPRPLPILTVKVSVRGLEDLEPTGSQVSVSAPQKPAAQSPHQITQPPAPTAAPAKPVQVAALGRPDLPTERPSLVDEGDGRAPWLRFAVPTETLDGRPLIALVIDDLGLDRRRTARALELSGPLTMAFLTYADDLGQQTRMAREAGHELLVHIPMEPSSASVDPGPEFLETGTDEAEIRRRLDWGLSRFEGYVGFNNHMGSRFTSDPTAMGVVLDEVRKRGLLFLDSRTSSQAVAHNLAPDMGIPWAERNVFLDHVDTEEAVARQLAEMETLARKHGYAVAIGHPRDATLNQLEHWLATAGRDFQLVPISAIARLKAEAATN
ncbi:MAG: divergent polysaccharide deacetylase family protein [Rhodospirillales bacterium]